MALYTVALEIIGSDRSALRRKPVFAPEVGQTKLENQTLALRRVMKLDRVWPPPVLIPD